MEVDIVIVTITECLVERFTQQIVETEFRPRSEAIRPKDYRHWKFNWKKNEENGYTIYELFVIGSDEVQGRIFLRIDGGVADVEIVEIAPRRMVILEDSANILLSKYMKKE